MEQARDAIGGPDGGRDAATVADQLKQSLDATVARAQAGGYTAAETQSALFAVVAWMDELAMSRDWAGAAAWRLSPLQRHYFATTRAGAEFFEKLEALPDEAIELREVYGLVLLAGFAGRYIHRPPAELAQYRSALLERIAQERQMAPLDPDLPLFPMAGARRPKMAQYRRGLGPSLATFILIVLPLCALLGLYLYLDYGVAAEAARITASAPTGS